MKKLIYLVMSIVTLSTLMTSCLSDNDEASKASVNYFGSCDTVMFADINDTIFYAPVIAALATPDVGLTFSQYVEGSDKNIFTETASSNQSMTIYAVAKCNEQALETYKQKLAKCKGVDAVKKYIWANYSKSFSKWGISPANESEIPLDGFTVKLSLWNYFNGSYGKLEEYTKTF